MRVLIACESSGTVRRAFQALGHVAYSADLLPADDATSNHFTGDAMPIANDGTWDLVIAHPPCTHLAVSGAAHFAKKRADGRQQQGIDLFMSFASVPCGKLALENPIGIMSTLFRKPDQIIQPWMFGHPETKSTCLWLKGLPKLAETKNVKAEMLLLPANQRHRLHYLPPSADRWKLRSKTFQGVAEAMAEQWG